MAADYDRAAAVAVSVLMDSVSSSAATDIFRILDHDDSVRLVRYSVVARRLGVPFSVFIQRFAESELSYTRLSKRTGIYIIMYNDNMLDRNMRSNVAHEYAHTRLGHHIGNGNNDEENEANCCSRLIMCPAPIADNLGVTTISDYVQAFDVSDELASMSKYYRAMDRETFARHAPDLIEAYGSRANYPRRPFLRKAVGSDWLLDIYDD